MAAPTGYAGITLEGESFQRIAVNAPTIRRREVKSILEGGPGGRREHLAWRPTGYPVRTHKIVFSLEWTHLRESRDRVEEILAGPGPFRFCCWKPVHLRYVGDGVTSEFFLAHELGAATETLTPPVGDLSSFLPVVKIGLDGTPKTFLLKSTVDYDAGTPASGEVWFRTGSGRFKLESAPEVDAVLCAKYVPLLSVIEGESVEKRYTNPVRDPRPLELWEV